MVGGTNIPTLYENFNTGNDDASGFYGTQWEAQTFTPSIAHTITSVKLLLYRVGSPGTITIGIRDTDGSGLPTGADLASGTTNGNTLTTLTAGEWREITLGAGYVLPASSKYAIVARAVDGSVNNEVYWNLKVAGGYGGGNGASKTGANPWAAETFDFMFEDWGDAAFIPKIFFI